MQRCRRASHGSVPAGLKSELTSLGAQLGSGRVAEWARLANTFPPQLRNFDRNGRRIDEVEFHPAWHEVMRLMIGAGVHADPWADPKPGAQVARAAKYLLFSQVENGAQCPVTMTYAVVPVMQRYAAATPAIARDWLPRILSHDYDPASLPIGEKRGALLGMGMTEKQGGSDVRANTTFAEPDGRGDWGERYRITGHKWFFSVPQSDAHLVLAQTDRESPAGLSCFFMPRWRADGTRNRIAVQRLKDKVGNKSNASSEVEFDGAEAYLVGEIGRGVPTILEMGTHTRLDCAIGSAGILRAVLTHALHHARERIGVRPPSCRAAADAQRAGRSRARVRGRDAAGAAAGARVRWPPRARRTRGAAGTRADSGREVLGLQATARRQRPRRWK